MVLGLSRTRLRPDTTRIFPVRTAPAAPRSRDWLDERGAVVFEAHADIFGGFPGYADRGGILQSITLRITGSYLLAAEGEQHGFGLPLAWIAGVALVAQPGREDHALRVRYRDGSSPRLFTIAFRPQRLPARTVRRPARAREALLAGGLPDQPAGGEPLEPSFTLPWDQTREFENENVIWTGQATAPVRVGAENAPSEVWLTTRSLIWGSGEGEGINRVPLPLLMDLVSTRLRDRVGTPVVYLAIGDERTGRFELPFVFDQQQPPDRNFRERGAFVVGLRSRGVPDGVATPLWQPWRPGVLPLAAASAHAGMDEPEGDAGLEPDPAVSIDEPEEQIAVAYQTWPDPDAVERGAASPLRRRAHAGEVPRPARISGTPSEGGSPTPAATGCPSALRAPVPPRTEDDTDEFPRVAARDPGPATGVVVARWPAPVSGADDAPVAGVTVREARPASADGEEAGREPARPAAVNLPGIAAVHQNEVDREHDGRPSAPEPAGLVAARPPAGGAGEPWTAIRRYEAAAIGALAEVLRAIDDSVAGRSCPPLSETPPGSFDQARALTELSDMLASGAIDAEVAGRRRERLLILGDVCVRLRTVVELHAGGHLTAAELERKRSALTRSLSDVLVPPAR